MLEDNQNIFENKEKTKINKIKNQISNFFIVILGIVIVILIGFYVFSTIITNRPQFIYKNIINNIFNGAENIYKNNISLDKSKYISGNLVFNTNDEEYKILNDEQINYNFGVDLVNKKAEAEIILKENNNEIINVLTEVKNNNVYLFLNKLFNQTILIDEETLEKNNIDINSLFDEFNENSDILFIINEFQGITNSVLNELNYEVKEESLKINDSNVKVKRMDLVFNKENIKTIFQIYTNRILDNDKLMEKLSKFTNSSVDEIKNNLLSLRKEIELSEINEENTKVSVFLSGIFNNLIKISYEQDNKELISYTNYKNHKILKLDNLEIKVEEEKLSVISDNKIVITGVVKSLEKNNLELTFKTVEDNSVEGKIKYLQDKNNKTLDVEFKSSNLLNLKLKMINTKFNINEEINNLNINLEVDNTKYEITNKLTITNNRNIATKDVNEYVNYNNLTDNDINTITNNLSNALSNSKIGDLLNSTNDNEYNELESYS